MRKCIAIIPKVTTSILVGFLLFCSEFNQQSITGIGKH